MSTPQSSTLAARSVAVYRHGQARSSKPICHLSREDAQWWMTHSSAITGEDPGVKSDRGKTLILSEGISTRFQKGNSLGPSLIFRFLQGDAEAIATVRSFAPERSKGLFR